jgi:hypothetical protein
MGLGPDRLDRLDAASDVLPVTPTAIDAGIGRRSLRDVKAAGNEVADCGVWWPVRSSRDPPQAFAAPIGPNARATLSGTPSAP